MRTKRAMLAVAGFVMLSGCVTRGKYYTWSSQQGKTCFYTCEKEFNNCMANCGGRWPSNTYCSNGADFCRTACPDLTYVPR
jgi:hypothetical protein